MLLRDFSVYQVRPRFAHLAPSKWNYTRLPNMTVSEGGLPNQLNSGWATTSSPGIAAIGAGRPFLDRLSKSADQKTAAISDDLVR